MSVCECCLHTDPSQAPVPTLAYGWPPVLIDCSVNRASPGLRACVLTARRASPLCQIFSVAFAERLASERCSSLAFLPYHPFPFTYLVYLPPFEPYIPFHTIVVVLCIS